MTKKAGIAPEPKGIAPGAQAPGMLDRPGFSIFVPGSLLKVGSKHWSDDQRVSGVWLRGVYLTATEEESAIVEAQRDNKLAAIGLYQYRKSFVAVADNTFVTTVDEEGAASVSPQAGDWQRVPVTSARGYWEELGPQGRQMFVQAYQLAHTPAEGERQASLASFRLEA